MLWLGWWQNWRQWTNAPPSNLFWWPNWLVQYRMNVNHSMEGIQGFTQCHWMPPSGKYLHRIAPVDKEVICKEKKQFKLYHICWPFWWPWWCAGMILCISPDGGGPGLQRKPADFFRVFSLSTCWKGGTDDVKAPDNKGMTYQTDGKELSNTM